MWKPLPSPLSTGVLVGVLAATFAAGAVARADEPGPARYVSTLSVGAPLRLTRNVDFDQSTLAPVYSDLLAGYVLSSSDSWRHGVGLGVSLNLSEDGGFTQPVGAARQLSLMPSYLLYWEPNPSWMMLGHAGIPVLVAGGRSAGFEVGVGCGHRLLAGFGFYGEAGGGIFVGGQSTVHPVVSLEFGVFLEHEVLP